MFAADDATPVRFEVEAPCSDAPRFAASVAARTPRIVSTDARDTDKVEIKVEGTHGSFRVVNAQGDASAPRTIDGATCEEVVSALGLAVALVFDPDASDKPKPTAPPSPSPPASPRRFPPPSAAPAPAPPSTRVAIGAHAAVAAASELPLGAFGFAELLSEHTSGRLAFGFMRTSIDVGAQSASFTWALVVPDVCPWRWVSARVELTPCMGMALGVVQAEPNDIAGASSFTRAWVAPKPMMRVRVLLSPAFALEAQLGAEVPLIRGHYTFGGVPAYDVAPVIPSFALGGWFSP